MTTPAAHLPPAGVLVLPVEGLGEIRPGDDLAAMLCAQAPWLADDDILVITSKVISKSEGRLVTVDPDPETGVLDEARRDAVRQQAITDETLRVVARRGSLRIVETRNGLVMAAAGVDASNVATDEIALLPVDPDASAAGIVDRVAALTGRRVAVVVSDSFGRPWRHGIVDVAIGAAGLTAVEDVRGSTDSHGNTLVVTEVAVADELAAAGDLVKGKLSHTPVAVVRGLHLPDDGHGSKKLLRGSGDDLFRLGTNEALALGRAQAAGAQDLPPDVADAVAALHADVLATLAAMPLHGRDAALREAFAGLLAARPDATRRACAPGHVTASAIVLDHSGERVLLTLHPRVGAWLQLGGHVEDDDPSLLAAAKREAAEESGIAGIVFEPLPVDLDIHAITCSLGIPTRHFDVRFVGRAPAGAEPVRSEESIDLAWFGIDELPDNTAPELPGLLRRIRDGLPATP